jgi:hypothetical protein
MEGAQRLRRGFEMLTLSCAAPGGDSMFDILL